MEPVHAILLGVIQGFTEFLPVSSKAHLVLGQKWLGIAHHDLTFDIVLHLGTLLSVFIFYRRLLIRYLRDVFTYIRRRTPNEGTMALKLVILASIPVAIMGFLFRDYFVSLFSDLRAVGVCLFIMGFWLFFARRPSSSMAKIFADPDLKEIPVRSALLIGVAQAFALAPGISRSGSTIGAGLFLGLSPDQAALFSFLLAIPAIIGAASLEATHVNFAELSPAPMAIGFATSFICGWLALILLKKILRRGRLEIFSVYLWILGALTFLYS